MTVTFGDVRTWDPAPLHTASGDLKKCSDKFVGLSDELRGSAVPEGWSGEGAAAARAKARRIADAWEDKAAVTAALDRGLFETGLAVEGLGHAIEVAEELARRNGFAVRDDGAVVSNRPAAFAPVGDVDDERDRVQAELVDRVTQIMRRANDIDTDVCALVERITSGELDSDQATSISSAIGVGTRQGAMPIIPPPSGASPTDNAAWWATLSPAERKIMLANHPELLGNRNGLPAQVRDTANRARIPVERERLQEAMAHAETPERLIEIRAKLQSLEAIEGMLELPNRQLLTLDMSHERAEAAIANGNVDTADHVAVFTPGLTSTVNGSMERYDQNMNDVKLRAQDILRAHNPDATIATITWLGYQAPQMNLDSLISDNSVLLDDAAASGARELAPFLDGIDAARTDDPHLTAMGHSYGSLTTGIALQADTGVDDAVVFGSPGLGTGSTDELQVPDGHILSLEANEDRVADIGRTGHLGEDPSSMDGIRHGETGATSKGVGVTGHSGYFTPDSTSLYNMAATVAGENQLVVDGNNTDMGDIVGQTGREVAHDISEGAEWVWEHMPWN